MGLLLHVWVCSCGRCKLKKSLLTWGGMVEVLVFLALWKTLLVQFEVWTSHISNVLCHDCFVGRILWVPFGGCRLLLVVVRVEILKVLLGLSMSGGNWVILFIIFILFKSIYETGDQVQKWFNRLHEIAKMVSDSARLALVLNFHFSSHLKHMLILRVSWKIWGVFSFELSSTPTSHGGYCGGCVNNARCGCVPGQNVQ